MGSEDDKQPHDDECVIHEHPVPADEVGRYTMERDPAAEQDIVNYLHGQAQDETVQHAERVKTEYIMGEPYEIWDVTTDKNRWWVFTNFTNLYLQKHFPSLDYTLSFHVGLMSRLRSRPKGADSSNPDPFDEVLRRRAELPQHIEKAQDANFVGWAGALMDHLCPGERNKTLRQYMKATSEKTWQLVNWLTHDRGANKTTASIAIDGCDTIVGQYVELLMRGRTERPETCPRCSSRNIRTHFDIAIEDDGAYFDTCGACDWTSHPGYRDEGDTSEAIAEASTRVSRDSK